MTRQTISSVLAEDRLFTPSADFCSVSHLKNPAEYNLLYTRSLADPEGFWSEMASRLDWFQTWHTVQQFNFHRAEISWFLGGKLNATYNCIDRHLCSWRKNKAAIIWQGENSEETKVYTYQELHRAVSRMGNVLKKMGIQKGDRVATYLPMIPELAITMLACARIGAIHNVVFAGFSAESLQTRINDSGCKLLVTADAGQRGGKLIPLKATADEALAGCPSLEKVIVCRHTGIEIEFNPNRDFWWDLEFNCPSLSSECPPEEMDAEDPLFILYTSGSTGKPKGVLHTTGGYLTHVSTTANYVFDLKDQDTYWCTADLGWVTGHSYVIYGPLSLGATTIMFEGVPNYPHPGRFWEIVEKYQVNIFYTAPTAIRAMMREGPQWPQKYNLSSLRLLGTVGEPINPEAWMWYHTNIGQERCPIVDTWWQTETGGIMISPLPGAIPTKPGSATKPFFGVDAAVVRADGTECGVNEGGYLVIRKPWPGIMRTVYGNHERFLHTYFMQYPGWYFTGDGARKDADGYFWLMGRIDDVINVAGHRLGTAEIESALVSHPHVAEAAVVGYPHPVKGEGIHSFVILREGYYYSLEIEQALIAHVRKVIGPIATPDRIQFCPGLPKTRSGKIMRRILRQVACGDYNNLGDTTTLADPDIVTALLAHTEQ